MDAISLEALELRGKKQEFTAGELVHSLDFDEELYFIKSGYIKRYSVTEPGKRSLQAIYGPNFFFPLTPIIKRLTGIDLGDEHATYIYESLGSAEVYHISLSDLQDELAQKPILYKDLLHEAGRRLRSNIHGLENNSLPSTEKKVAHHLSYLAEEFTLTDSGDLSATRTIPFAITAQDLADQLNVPVEDAANTLNKCISSGIVAFIGGETQILQLAMLKDLYL